MPVTQLTPAYQIFTDKNGDPLDAGYLYFGDENQNPETNPIQVYWDYDLTQPAAQPIRTINGYPSRNGSPSTIYANGYFSVTVRNKNSELVIYSPTGYGITPGTSASLTDQMTYNQGSTGAVDRVLTSRLQDYISVKDFGAVGDGITDDTDAFEDAQDTGKLIFVPESADEYFMPGTVTNTSAAYLPSPTLSWENFTSNGNLHWGRDFTTDGPIGASVWRFKDRVFVGDAADYTGNRLAANGYGDSWAINKGSNYYIKNSTLAVAAPELDETGQRRYGILGISKSMGVCAVAINDGVNTFARGLYAEVMHQVTGNENSAGIEVQMGNYTSNYPVANAYNMADCQTIGINIGAESGYNYEVGPNDDPITPATEPCGCAIDVAGGSIGASYQKWVVGMVMRDGALVRDAVTGIATAVSLARNHEISWGVGIAQPRAGFIRSTVTSDQTPGGILVQNRGIAVVGFNEQLVFEARDARANTDDAVNYIRIENSATGDPLDISAQGTDTDIDLRLEAKGAGHIRFGSFAGGSGSIAGWITIKDAAGVERKLAVIS